MKKFNLMPLISLVVCITCGIVCITITILSRDLIYLLNALICFLAGAINYLAMKKKPEKKKIPDNHDLALVNQSHNQDLKEYEEFILERLQAMKFPAYVVKTSEQLNMRIDKLIKEIRG